jgi:hypothetical protein
MRRATPSYLCPRGSADEVADRGAGMSLEMMVDTDGVGLVVQGSTAPDGGIGQILAYSLPGE